VSPTPPALRVVGALIEREGKVLVTQRPVDSRTWPAAWEFPGGKVEPGETDREALARELREELGINVVVGALFAEVLNHNDGGKALDLRIYCCSLGEQQPQQLEVAAIRWERPQDLNKESFPSADRPIIGKLLQDTQNSGTTAGPSRDTIER
tara:strand:+ start:2211 stop:2666 length:456 start_codon:yes stop_codon:yes gene_type:complete